MTKSGSKDFHGLESYFKRHEQFNAESSSGRFIQTPIAETPKIFYRTFQNLRSSAGLNFPQGVSGIDLNPKPTKAMNFSLSLQQDIGYGVILDVGYVGNVARNLLRRRNLNPVRFGANFLAANGDPTNP